jgi:hypothetical protein
VLVLTSGHGSDFLVHFRFWVMVFETRMVFQAARRGNGGG